MLKLGAESTFSWWVLIFFAFPSFSTSLIYDPQRLGAPAEKFLPVALGTYAATALMFAAGRLIKDTFIPRAGLVFALFWYLLIGLARGLVAYDVALDIGVGPRDDLLFRVISPPVFTATSLALFAAIVTTGRMQQDALGALEREQERLGQAISSFRETHERLRVELLARVNAIVAPAHSDIVEKMKRAGRATEPGYLLDELRQASDSIVRPLSHEIVTESVPVGFGAVTSSKRRTKWILPAKMTVELMPGWGSILALAVEIAPQGVARSIPDAGMVALLLGVSMFVTLKVLEGITARIKTSPMLALVVTVICYSGSAAAAPLYWVNTPWHLMPEERPLFLMIVTALAGVIFAISYTIAARREHISQLQDVNEQLNQLLSQLRRQVWLDRRRVATVLHGPIQGALQAAGIRISRAPELTDSLISQIEGEITDAFTQLNKSSEDKNVDFETVLDSIFAIWEDAVDLRVSFGDNALDVLRLHPDASESVIEIIREAINNAMKHGAPSSIAIKIGVPVQNLLSISVVNDGRGLSGTSAEGYGSNLMDELSHSWILRNVSEGVELSAEVVY